MKSIGTHLFAVNAGKQATPKLRFERVLARDLGLQETWFRDAIFENPELVIAPCRQAGRVTADEVWLPWRTETSFGAGPIDVLLVSSYGRIGIVETKLSYNPQKRREVVAQVLDYALSLQDTDREDLPELPASQHAPDESDLADALQSGKFLLVIAGDALDPRAMRLSQALLARHLTNEWDLAMIDLNVYREIDAGSLLVVPELLGTVQSDVRQVVRVKIEGQNPKARVEVEHVTETTTDRRTSNLASATDFMDEVQRRAPSAVEPVRRIVALFEAEAMHESIRMGFRKSTANLYWVAPTGSERRFLSVSHEGRVRVPFDYLEGVGRSDLATQLEALSLSLFNPRGSGQSAERKVDGANVEELLSFVRDACVLMRAA
ncbi:hypothetical protein [Pseudoxanthomonas sp. PXM01]|uniref:hypothetical protein n=1 Tax=Pseudoxanthomonas sp. PXM01 TaxID=2769295 RepID=UPI001782E511|nr:hypothetical protein [Pseudoxanthomonas sp. PXM01]MBD9470214.1 hypothetical protein [Pseudoxanthomonas sp. PXM01]